MVRDHEFVNIQKADGTQGSMVHHDFTVTVIIVIIVILMFVIGLARAEIIERKNNKAYVHYTNSDKRLDEWVDIEAIRFPRTENNGSEAKEEHLRRPSRVRKRKIEVCLFFEPPKVLNPT